LFECIKRGFGVLVFEFSDLLDRPLDDFGRFGVLAQEVRLRTFRLIRGIACKFCEGQ
jgi:hypothetical protein